MKAVADTLGVARSQLAARLTHPVRPRGPSRKPQDAVLLPAIREIVEARPSYGYRRITALLNRVLRSRGEPVVNAKRVLRILHFYSPKEASAMVSLWKNAYNRVRPHSSLDYRPPMPVTLLDLTIRLPTATAMQLPIIRPAPKYRTGQM